MKKSKKPKFTNGLIDKLLKNMNINDTYTKPIKYNYPKFKNEIFPQSYYNYQMDLLELPTTKLGYKYLLTMIDVWGKHVDFEPIKNKSAQTVLDAMKEIFKRGILKKPESSIRSDMGGEFKNSLFDKYMFENSILHRYSLPDRHKQLAPVERLNKDLGQILLTYTSDESIKQGIEFNEWSNILDTLRTELNKIKIHPPNKDPFTNIPKPLNIENEPKYKIGDLVYRRLEIPYDKYGNKYHNQKFRAGDNRYEINEARKIVKVLLYTSKNPYRYILNGFPNVSYAEEELLPANESEEKYIVHKIIGKKVVKGKIFYLVYWKKFKKSESTWEPKDQLIEDGCQEYIDQYEEEQRNK